MRNYRKFRSGEVCAILFASWAQLAAVNATELAPMGYGVDAQEQIRYASVDRYFTREGIYLSKEQIQMVLAEDQGFVEYTLSNPRTLQGTNGTAQFEVVGEGQIQFEYCLQGQSCANKWAGAYVHTPAEDEVLLGYRSLSSSSLGTTSSNKAVWGRVQEGDVSGELGSTADRTLFLGGDIAYGVRGQANSETADKNYGVYGRSNMPGGVGVYGVNTTPGGKAGHFEGPVEQENQHGGIVKAAVLAYCGPDSGYIIRSFGPTGTAPSVTIEEPSKCTINFGFDISERFFQVTPIEYLNAIGVTCVFSSDKTQLRCHLFHTIDGSPYTGQIMLTLY